jgi:hypothetical protein
MTRDHDAENGVAQELEALVRLLADVFCDERAVDEREMNQIGIDLKPEALRESDGRDRRSARNQ